MSSGSGLSLAYRSLTPELVAQARTAKEAHTSANAIAVEFNISRATVYQSLELAVTT
jgi:DNA invertase Pin-like site-specific DNA recombinase